MATLQEQVREAAGVAKEQSVDEGFNAMSWLDLVLEENPESFDVLFDKAWAELSEDEMVERNATIRKVL